MKHNDFTSYQAYLQSDHWKKTRAYHISKFSRCLICGEATNLHVHHIRYTNIGNEQHGDLVTVCSKCHYKFHFTKDRKFKKLFKRKRRAIFRRPNRQQMLNNKAYSLNKKMDEEFFDIVKGRAWNEGVKVMDYVRSHNIKLK